MSDLNHGEIASAETQTDSRPDHRSSAQIRRSNELADLFDGREGPLRRGCAVGNIAGVPVPPQHLFAILGPPGPIDERFDDLHPLRDLRRRHLLIHKGAIEGLDVVHVEVSEPHAPDASSPVSLI